MEWVKEYQGLVWWERKSDNDAILSVNIKCVQLKKKKKNRFIFQRGKGWYTNNYFSAKGRGSLRVCSHINMQDYLHINWRQSSCQRKEHAMQVLIDSYLSRGRSYTTTKKPKWSTMKCCSVLSMTLALNTDCRPWLSDLSASIELFILFFFAMLEVQTY